MPVGNPGKKSDKVTFEKRVRLVQEWILQGYTSSYIIPTITTQWDIGERQAWKYYREAFQRFSDANQEEIAKKTAIHIARREKLFRDLEDKHTPTGARAALRILDSEARIDGTVRPFKKDTSVEDFSADTVFDVKKQYKTNAEIIQKLAEIKKSI